ncbi:UDP-2,3-diacylglucosamine diphosphatase [Pseudomarimonas arenosa]|uniref:UDP-2,3-diacylglucosamine diphosphatase n=1 Tax=Pseudomarimonas arenosa TaxID=2774145 RepID=A0AAW3ZLB3_9GAMM|nr:UDP-2,3-diacylglucosamine diphosphatase [Pseudomarimonas arenosa]MBD8526250.1 UDP-2,3-diacylglucosamine diphosphatase [Pseudomarimonas arenosa]
MKPLYRSVFISDIHLGTPECRVNYLLSFLRQLNCEQLYLVGDVIDLEAMEKRHYWPAEHTQVMLEVLSLARRGIKVTYIPGNHDCQLRRLAGQTWGGVEIKLWAEHTAADGRRYRVSHGDEFDPEAMGKRWLLWVGEHAQRWLSMANRAFNRLRRGLSLPYLPLSIIAKSRVSAALHYIQQFEHRVSLHARNEGYDGHICGHIHFGHVQSYDGVLYLNDGDWVEHCTALTEDQDGRMNLLHWSDHCTAIATADQGRVDHWQPNPLPLRSLAPRPLAG